MGLPINYLHVGRRSKVIRSLTGTAKKRPVDFQNIFCPIPGCGNWGGRGFRRSRIRKHLMGQHPNDLVKDSPNYLMVSTFLEPLDRKVCVACNRIYMRCTDKGFCESCDKGRPVAKQITRDLTEIQREKSFEMLKSIQKTKFTLRRSVPRKLCTLWSDLLTDIALGMADASKESEALSALKRYLMVKAVLIQPVRGGGGRRNRSINLTQKLMAAFFKGKEDKVWQTSMQIENKRKKSSAAQTTRRRTKRSLNGKVLNQKKKENEGKRRSERAKVLTNDGALSKAYATMVQRGVAPSSNEIIAQLTSKFPKRKKRVQWPDESRIDELRKVVEDIVVETDVDEDDLKQETTTAHSDSLLSESLKELHESIENDFQAVQIQWKDIFVVASRAKNST